jgi:dipeptidyl aminopeptidase/acylaminoacyl peptidase
MIRLNAIPIVFFFLIVLIVGCATSAQRYDIAFIEQNPNPDHLRFLSTSGELSSPVFLPNGMAVHLSGHNSLSWSPDGQSLAFASRVSGNLDIYTISANGTGFSRVTHDPARDESPAWSPDGTKIVFLSNRNDIYLRDIYVHDLTNGNETRLTTTSDYYISPAWSPDNSKIAYGRSVSAAVGDEIFILDLNTGTAAQVGVLPGPGLVQGLRWAPSADNFLFYSPGTFGDVHTVKIDGTGLQNLTGDTASEMSTQPSWYSGSQVLYIKVGVSPQTGIYRMALDGTGKNLIKALDDMPWSPVYRFAAVDLPDLVVSSHSSRISVDVPTSPQYIVEFKIQNIGTAQSVATLVYIDAINPDPPAGQNKIMIQKQTNLAGLSPGEESDVFQITFDLSEIYAKDVREMSVTADPKESVSEAFETNNTAFWTWP